MLQLFGVVVLFLAVLKVVFHFKGANAPKWIVPIAESATERTKRRYYESRVDEPSDSKKATSSRPHLHRVK